MAGESEFFRGSSELWVGRVRRAGRQGWLSDPSGGQHPAEPEATDTGRDGRARGPASGDERCGAGARTTVAITVVVGSHSRRHKHNFTGSVCRNELRRDSNACIMGTAWDLNHRVWFCP